MEARMIYITCRDREQALHIGKELVEARLAACANLLDQMTSLYWWEGKVVQDQECVLLLKTQAGCVEPLMQRVRELHSYEVPCIIALPIVAGNPDYLHWIAQETQPHD